MRRFEEAKTLFRRTIPVAQRVLGGNNNLTLKMRWHYAEALYKDTSATPDDLREAVTSLEELERTTRRVFGSAHPTTVNIERDWQYARAKLAASVCDGVSSICKRAQALCMDPGATLADVRGAVTMLEETDRTARHVFGGAHPTTESIERTLRDARAALAAREAAA